MATYVSSGSDDSNMSTQLCDWCTRDGESTLAVKWCTVCKEALCEPCYVCHRRSKALSKHRTVPMEDVTEQEILASRLEIDIYCKSHKTEPFKLYCRSHNVFCCTLCAFTNHQECKTMIPIDDLSQAYEDNNYLEKQTAVFVETKKKVQTAIDEKDLCLANFIQDKSAILLSASGKVRKAKNKLDELYANLEKNIIKEYEKCKKSQEDIKQILVDFREKIEQGTQTMKTLQHATPTESVIMMETLKSEIELQYQEVTGEVNKDFNVRITFKLNPTLKSFVDNITSLGDIQKESYSMGSSVHVASIQELIDSLDIGMVIGSPAQYPIVPKKDFMTASVKLVKSVTCAELHLKSGSNPWLSDVKVVDRGNLLLLDREYRRLVLLNDDMKIKREIKVNGSPTCMDLSDDEKVVHVVCDGNSVHHYSLQGGEEDGRMKVEREAWGIGVIGNTTIIGQGVFGSNRKVVLYDVQGKNMNSVTRSGWFTYIAVSNDGQRFYYSDGNIIIACDKQFNVIWRYKSDDWITPRGICVDPCDNVYVVGNGSNNIHQISSDGTRHRVLVQQLNTIKLPRAIAFNKTRDTFVVTSDQEDVAFEMYAFST